MGGFKMVSGVRQFGGFGSFPF